MKLTLLVAPSPSLYFVANIVLMKAHGNGGNLFHRRARCLVREKNSTKVCRNGSTAGSVPLLVKAVNFAQNIPFAFVEKQSVEWMVLHRVWDVLACGQG